MGCLIRAQRGLRRATNNEDRLRFLGSDTPVGFFKVTWVACGGQKQVPSVGECQVFHVSEWITANTSKFGRYTPLAAGILSRLEVWPDTLFEERPRPSRPRPHALQRHPLYLSHPRWFGGFASLWEPSARQEPMPRGIVQPQVHCALSPSTTGGPTTLLPLASFRARRTLRRCQGSSLTLPTRTYKPRMTMPSPARSIAKKMQGLAC